MAEWPDLRAVRRLLRMQSEAVEDGLIDQARLAAINWCYHRTGRRWPPDGSRPIPDAVAEAATLLGARYYRRRDSLDGTIGWDGMGVVRVGRGDPDVEALLGPWLPVVFG